MKKKTVSHFLARCLAVLLSIGLLLPAPQAYALRTLQPRLNSGLEEELSRQLQGKPATVSPLEGSVVALPSWDSGNKMFFKDSNGNAFFAWVTGDPVSIDRKTGRSSTTVQLRLFSFNPITAERLKALQDRFEFRVAQADREGLRRSEWKKLDRLQEALGVQFPDEDQNQYHAAAEFTLEGWWDVDPDSLTASAIPASIFIEVQQKEPPLPSLPEADSLIALPAPKQAGLEEMIREVSGNPAFRTYVIADPLMSMLERPPEHQAVAMTIPPPAVQKNSAWFSYLNGLLGNGVKMARAFSELQDKVPALAELEKLVREGDVVLLKLSALLHPERHPSGIGVGEPSSIFLNRSGDEYLRGIVWEERIHLALDRLDAEPRGHILEAIRGSNHSVVAAIANLVQEVTGYPLRTTENAEEVFPRLLWLYRDSNFVQRVIQEVFPSDLAVVVSDIRKRTDPSAEDIHTAIAVARTMEQGLREQSYFETLRDFMNRKTAERHRTGSEEGFERKVPDTEGTGSVSPSADGLEEGTDLEELLASARIVERKVGSETVPMLQLSDPVRLPADDRWWETVGNATQGLRVIAGVSSNERVVPSQAVGPIFILRVEQGRVRIYQPSAGMQLIGSVEPGGEKIIVGSGSRPGQGKIEGLTTDDAIYSRQHFSVRWGGQGIVIEDEGSEGGTYLLENEISEILDAVEEQEAESAAGVELAVREGGVVAVVNRLSELREWIASLEISLTRRQTRQLYHGNTVVARGGERYRLAVLRSQSVSLEKLSGRVVFVQKGILSADVLNALRQKNEDPDGEEVFEVDATDADLIVQILDQLMPIKRSAQKVPKPILITTSDSDLEQQVLRRYGARQRELPAEWKLPLATVSVPSEVAIGEWPLENLAEYLAGLAGRADELPGHTEETIRAFEQKEREIWVLLEPSAGLEEGLDPEVKNLLNRMVDSSKRTATGRLYALAQNVSDLEPVQRTQFVQNLIWYSDRKEIADLLEEIFLREDPLARAPVRMVLLDAIKNDLTGETVDAFETVFSQLPLGVMEQVFHRLLGSINNNEQLQTLLSGVTGLISREAESERASPMSGRESLPLAGRERILFRKMTPAPATLREVSEVLFEEIEAAPKGNWRSGWETQGPSLALALEHALVFTIVRRGVELHVFDEELEGFLYGRLNEIARERVWLSRSRHPPELPTEMADIEGLFSEFYGLIAQRLLDRSETETSQKAIFPSQEATEAHRLFLDLRRQLHRISQENQKGNQNQFLQHRVLERLVELEDDYANYLLSLASLKQKDHRFLEMANAALRELQREFQATQRLERYRKETRARLGLLEPPAETGLEEPPLVEGDQVVLNRVADWLKQKLNALRADDRSLPEVDLVLIQGSAVYLSDDQNRLPVAVMNSPDLIEDLDVEILTKPSENDYGSFFEDVYANQVDSIMSEFRQKLAQAGVSFSRKMDFSVKTKPFSEILVEGAEFFIEGHSDVREYDEAKLIRTAWVPAAQWDSQYDPLDVAKRYLEVEQLAGDLAYYRHYRDRLVSAADPAAEAAKILQEALEAGRQEALIKKLDDPQAQQQTLDRIQKRMEDRLVGLEPAESENAASWVNQVLGYGAVMPESARGQLMAGKEIIWGRRTSGDVIPALIRLVRVNKNLPKSHSIQKDRTIYVEKGFLPAEVVAELAKFSAVAVREIGPEQAQAVINEQKDKNPKDHKSLFVVRQGSELEVALNQALEQEPGSWNFPMAVVAVPAALVSQISARDLTRYLGYVLTQADPIAQRRMERLESIRDTGAELQLLSTRA